MENQRDSETTKLKSTDGAVSPIKVYSRRRRSSSTSGPHASDNSDSPCDLKKYLRWADSKLDSPTTSITPVKVEDDVIVMDEIPVPKSSKGGSEVRTYSGGRSNSTTLPSASGGVIENIKPQKNTLCRYWKTFGTCKSGSKCQLVHVEEELQRPPPSSGEIKHEIFKSKSNLEGSASPSYGKNYSPISQAQSPSAAEEASSSPSLTAAMAALSTAPAKVKHLSGSAIPSSTVPEASQRGTDWSPLDEDSIEINLPFTKDPSKEDVDAYIREALSGTKSKKRLPVFEEICPE